MKGIHPAQIKMLIGQKGKTLKQLAREHSVSQMAVNKGVNGSSSLGEQIISEFLEIPLHEIWPELWTKNGVRIKKSED